MASKLLRFFALAGPLWFLGAIQPFGIQASEVQRLLDAAKEKGERELNLSWGEGSLGGHQGNKRFEGLFNRMYGTNVKFIFTPGPSMARMAGKVAKEVAAGKKASTDILIGTVGQFAPLRIRQALGEYDYSKLSPRISKDLLAPRNIGVEIYSAVPAIIYNPKSISPADVPTKLEDVLNPKWKGKIASTPYAAYFDRIAMRPEWGVEKMRAFGKKLSSQIGGLIRVGEETRIASGEFVMFVMGPHQGALRLQAKGAQVGYVIPEDSAIVQFGYLGVPLNSTHPNLAKLFINMVASKEGQKIVYETEFTDHYALPGSRSAAVLSDLKSKGVEILEVDAQYVMEHPEMNKLRRAFQKILRRKK